MYVVNTGQILESLTTFNKANMEDIELHAYAQLLVEDVVAVFNSKEFDNAYDRSGYFTKLLGGNIAVETLYIETLDALREYTRKSGWDSRCHMRIDDRKVQDKRGFVNQLFLVMDLESTMDAMFVIASETVAAGEMISDNPTPDELSKVLS